MTLSHRVSAALLSWAILAAILLAGCAPSRSQQFRTSFVPPAPRSSDSTDTATLPSEPPAVTKEYIKELPNLLAVESAPARSTEVETRLRRADQKFETGKRAYQDGKLTEARAAFDEAVDILLRTPEGTPDRAKLERRLDQMVDTIYRYDVNGLGVTEEADKVGFDQSPLDSILEMTFPMDPTLKPKVSVELQGTASQLPLDESDSVLSYIHFFSTERGKRILVAGLRRAGRYRPLIRRVLDEEGVPEELIYLAQAESGFLPRAVSYKSAAGMWQFLSWRGKEYGLAQTGYTDDRLDPEKATRAAAHHLHDLYSQFGDWYLAMAAYNCGPNCVDRAVQRTGYADFWALSRLNVLPTQTQNYVPVILAITIMAKNPQDYGLEGIDTDPPIDYDSIKLEAATNLELIADALERPVSEIRELNPAVLKGIAPQGYELRVPRGSTHALVAALDAVPATRRASSRLHRVEKGETLAAIARRYRTAPAAIVSANNSTVSAPEEGDLLLIPAAYQARPVVARTTAKNVRRTAAARTAPAARTPVRKAAAQRVPAKTLQHRAPARRLRTASIGTSAGGQ
jgi:membrane-bound lytic murein transglycosylase D